MEVGVSVVTASGNCPFPAQNYLAQPNRAELNRPGAEVTYRIREPELKFLYVAREDETKKKPGNYNLLSVRV